MQRIESGAGAQRLPEGQTVADLGEFGLIDAMTADRPDLASAPVEVGPGDDSAVIRASDGRVVVSCDMFAAGVHFRTDWASGAQIGQRCAVAAMADICAMGAVPTALVVGFSAPGETLAQLVVDIATGISAAAGELGASLVGGDVIAADQLTVSITVLGDLRGARPVLRSGAQPGDIVALAGRIGWAAAGLAVLSHGFRSPLAVVNAYRVPDPPLLAGSQAAATGATAMLDVSDGLLADLGHIAAGSNVEIDVASAALPVPDQLAQVASALGADPLRWLLTGGEDHALAATFPAGTELPQPWRQIGRVTGALHVDQRQRVTVDGADYEDALGYAHFR